MKIEHMKNLKRILILLIPVALFACKKSEVDQAKIDREIIRKYIADSALVADSTASGLFYVIADSGVGTNRPTVNSTVWVYYKGYYPQGGTFDSNEPGLPTRLSLNNTINGWKEGIPLIKKGGKIKLLIPSALAYGTTGRGSIPGNSVLIFDITLDSFQ
jgi:FKBP-type peptidyl-prolyl cis-trans isomerase FkpA